MSKIKAKGNQLVEIRIKKGLTVRKLHELSGVNTAVINRTEKGMSSPNPKTAQRLCKALGVNFDEIFQII